MVQAKLLHTMGSGTIITVKSPDNDGIFRCPYIKCSSEKPMHAKGMHNHLSRQHRGDSESPERDTRSDAGSSGSLTPPCDGQICSTSQPDGEQVEAYDGALDHFARSQPVSTMC